MDARWVKRNETQRSTVPEKLTSTLADHNQVDLLMRLTTGSVAGALRDHQVVGVTKCNLENASGNPAHV
jgi:hypothetical protein